MIRRQIEETDSSYDKEKLTRIAASGEAGGGRCGYQGGCCDLTRETELKEKKHRFEDALSATRAAVEEGIVPGGGVALLRAQSALEGMGIWYTRFGGQAMTSDTLSALTQRGLAIYDAKLKSLLEPSQNNRYVAIHVPTEDYAVGRSSGDAMRELLRRHPVDGQVVVRKIGPEPDYGMASRVLAGEMQAESRS